MFFAVKLLNLFLTVEVYANIPLPTECGHRVSNHFMLLLPCLLCHDGLEPLRQSTKIKKREREREQQIGKFCRLHYCDLIK